MKGGQVTGSWEEKTYSAKGEVTGRYSGEGFALTIQGANFTAAMNCRSVGLQADHQHHAEGLGRHQGHDRARQVLAAAAAVAATPLLLPDRIWCCP